MNFSYPLVLLFLVVPAGLLVWAWKRDGRRVVLPFDHGLPGSGRRWHVIIGLAESLPALVLAVAVVVIAGPQAFGEPKTRRALTNIEICLDVSGSMVAPYGDGSRYDTAMKSVQEFLDYRKGDAFGLTFFGNNVLHWCPLTSDVSAIRCSPPFMRPENLPMWFNGTEIARALKSCKQVLSQRQEGDRMILLITDGESFDLMGNDSALAKELKDANITVYAVIIGMDQIQDEIHTITTGTGGQAFLPGDPEAFKAVFQRIDRMQQTRLEKTIAEAADWFFPFCVAGLSALGLGTLALFGVRYTPW